MRLRPSIWLVLGILVLAGGGLGAGCQSLTVVPEAPPRSTPQRPLWNDASLREHLDFFNGSDVEGRATGTAGYATAAAYVAARMGEFGLQPALAGNAQVIYPTPINEVRGAAFLAVGLESDTLQFYNGVDYLPDGRSDSGQVEIGALVIDPVGATEGVRTLPGSAVLVPAQKASTEYLQTLREAGAQVALLMGPLTPRPATLPIRSLIVVQILPETAMGLMRITRANLSAQLGRDERLVWRLPRAVRLRVEGLALPQAGGLNVLGYTPGKHPALAEELVIVCADLDAVGTFAGVPTLDTAHLGVGATALLEVAEHYAFFARFESLPERSVLFAVFSGGRQGHAGLRAYLRHPLWALDHTRAVIYVGLDPSEEPAVRSLLDVYDLPLRLVATPPDTLGARGVVLLPERRPPRRRTLRPSDEEAFRSDPPRLSDLIDVGVVSARQMAEALHALLLREAATGASLVPVDADTLRVPVEN